MKTLAERAAVICEACKSQAVSHAEDKAIEEYPVNQILWAFENRSFGKSPMFWGYYEYKGKKYSIEIIVKETEK
jgi:hypothetical protein